MPRSTAATDPAATTRSGGFLDPSTFPEAFPRRFPAASASAAACVSARDCARARGPARGAAGSARPRPIPNPSRGNVSRTDGSLGGVGSYATIQRASARSAAKRAPLSRTSGGADEGFDARCASSRADAIARRRARVGATTSSPLVAIAPCSTATQSANVAALEPRPAAFRERARRAATAPRARALSLITRTFRRLSLGERGGERRRALRVDIVAHGTATRRRRERETTQRLKRHFCRFFAERRRRDAAQHLRVRRRVRRLARRAPREGGARGGGGGA